ncbi:hypothetical protein VTL71DRAFT_6114 [Oculimacula yallundae]|uniref:Uncharacterized protein n=1 Tax=Oculimacula yallundae TaxID=86028 RepID=A0ABR4C041_9HELO
MNELQVPMDRLFYNFDPSLSAAIIFAMLYTLAFAGTLLQFIRYKSWVWTIMVISSGMEAGGYIARCFSVQDPTNQLKFNISLLMIFLAPVCMAAACYIVFVGPSTFHSFQSSTNIPHKGRIIHHVVPKESRTIKVLWLPARFITPIFVTGDLSIDLNAPPSQSLDRVNKGKGIAEVGVGIQLVFFGLFSIIAIRFNFTSRRFKLDFEQRSDQYMGSDKGGDGKFVILDGDDKIVKRNWQAILLITNLASVCILIRSVYRMLDFHMGREGYLDSHEWSFYVFDSLVILPAIALFIWWHPSAYLPYMGFRLPKHRPPQYPSSRVKLIGALKIAHQLLKRRVPHFTRNESVPPITRPFGFHSWSFAGNHRRNVYIATRGESKSVLTFRTDKKCSGYRDQLALMFRDENEKVLTRFRAPRHSSKQCLPWSSKDLDDELGSATSNSSCVSRNSMIAVSFPLPISPAPVSPFQDEEIRFDFTNCVSVGSNLPNREVEDTRCSAMWRLLCTERTSSNAVSSIRYAGLSNVTKDLAHTITARKKYAASLRDSILALKDTSKSDLDATFQSVMLLAALEV